jgi:hypothetical protein
LQVSLVLRRGMKGWLREGLGGAEQQRGEREAK